MSTPRTLRPEVGWLLLAGALCLALAAWAGWTVVTKHQQAAARLAEVEPRHARLAGMLQNKELFAQSGQALQANLKQFIYAPGGDSSQTANTALQRVRDLAVARRLRVTSSQTAAPRDEDGFDRIGLTLRIEGEWPELVAFMGDLAAQQPAVYTTNLQLGVQSAGVRGEPRAVFGQFDLYVLKERQP